MNATFRAPKPLRETVALPWHIEQQAALLSTPSLNLSHINQGRRCCVHVRRDVGRQHMAQIDLGRGRGGGAAGSSKPRLVMIIADPGRESTAAMERALSHAAVEGDDTST
jgi:hypothetical protein